MSIRTSENAKKVIARVYSLFLKMYPQISIRLATLIKSNRKKVLACEYFWGVRIKKKTYGSPPMPHITKLKT